MQLIQISEPEEKRSEIPEVVVGIDFGTTHSLVAISHRGKVDTICNSEGVDLIKSTISCNDGEIEIGLSNSSSVRSIKRLIAKRWEKNSRFVQHDFFEHDNDEIKVKLGDKRLTVVECIAHILRHLIMMAENYLHTEVKHAVITVPAYFSEVERCVIKDAARIIGLNVLRLINEPTAAALAYGLQNNQDNGVYLVYDLGGGTFDVSILRKVKGVFQVLATGGDVLLGGDDFDQALMQLIQDKYSINDPKILDLANDIKRRLTSSQQVAAKFMVGGAEKLIEVNREEFNQAIRPYVEKTICIAKSVISQSGLNISDIKSVVLVGGTTRILLVRELVQEIFGEEKVLCDVDPDRIVVMGAAIQAYALTSGSINSVLIDVLPLSLGIEVMGGLMDVMIEKNTPLPIARSRSFTTFCDGQTVMKIRVFQGEREVVKNNNLLGDFDLSGITPAEAGKVKVKVTFIVDVDGLLTVEAVEENEGGVRREIVVQSNYGLTDQEVDDILANSFSNAEADLKERQLIESRVKARETIISVRKAIKYNQFTSEQLKKLEKLLYDLEQVINNTNCVDSQSGTISELEALESYFQPLIKQNIDNYVKKKLVGNTLNDDR